MPEPIVELEAVTRDYGKEIITRALRGVDLQVNAGEFAAVVGPSGSGKSTLLNIMGLLDRPTDGRVFVDGEDTHDFDDDAITDLRGKTLGFIFQSHHLLTAFSALENVMMPTGLARGRFDDDMRRRATELLESVGLAEQVDKNVRKLSGGQKQRVAVARALVMQPDLVLSDEPTGNLDTETADKVFALLRRLNSQTDTAFFIVTHDEPMAERCDRVIRLVDGEVVEDRAGSRR
jgi:lipoprotein-releasing system ATP-binding protein